MLDILFVPIALIYLAVVGMLFIYGVNFFYLTFRAWRAPQHDPLPPVLNDFPMVTVQLPVYNELYVAERLINAAANLDYPNERLQVQVLDDSTDDTVDLIRAVVERWQAKGIDIIQIRRANRSGFKAGALANGLQSARGDFIAIFDADFIPPSDFLKRTVPHFQDAGIAFIQTRWGHVNRDYSVLTFLQSLAIDAHFVIEQFARHRGNYWFNFNGTAGIWRRAALEDAGGWTSDTLTEDLDLSYRAFLRGWRALYLREVETPAELPVAFSAYRRQQHRWARGSLECAWKFLPRVWQANLSWQNKVEATLHLTGYGVHLLLFALVLLYPVVLLLSAKFPGLVSLFGIAFVFNATAFAPTLFFVVAQQQLGRRWWRVLPAILFITVLGAGMMVNTTRAAWQIMLNPHAPFERTPKFGIAHKKQNWRNQRYQLRLDRIVWFEIALALLNLWTTCTAIQFANYAIAIYAALFAFGLFFTSGITLAQTILVEYRQNLVRAKGHAIIAPIH